jgi:hypothetical protein
MGNTYCKNDKKGKEQGSDEAKYRCKRCGRYAKKEEKVCKPEKVKP